MHAIVKLVDFGATVDTYGPVPATVPMKEAVRDALVQVAGVVKGDAYAGGLPLHTPLDVDGEHVSTGEHPARYAAPGIPDKLAVAGEAAVNAADENETPSAVFEKLEPPAPPKGR